MRLLGKTAIVLGLAGAMALGSMTASEARFRAGPAAAVGFIAGAAIGAAAANANAGYYYGGSSYGYDSYAYEPAYAEPVYTPPSYYGPVYADPGYGYSNNYRSNQRDRQLQGRDW